MSEQVSRKKTSLPPDEVTTRAVEFFSGTKWRTTSQAARAVSFQGRAPIPWLWIVLTVIGLFCCFIPGIVLYFVLIRKAGNLQTMVVSTTPFEGGCDVMVKHPDHANKEVAAFLTLLPGETVAEAETQAEAEAKAEGGGEGRTSA